MQAIVLGKNDQWIKTLEGTYRDGVFTYVEGQNRIPLIGLKFGGTVEKIDFDYDKTISLGGKIGNAAVYKWDGKNLTQLSLKVAMETSVIVDYVKDFKMGEYAKNAILKPPVEDSLVNAMKWVAWIVIFITLVISIWSSYHAVNVINTELKNTPFTNISIQNQQILNTQQSEIKSLSVRDNYTDNLILNLSRYLERSSLG